MNIILISRRRGDLSCKQHFKIKPATSVWIHLNVVLFISQSIDQCVYSRVFRLQHSDEHMRDTHNRHRGRVGKGVGHLDYV